MHKQLIPGKSISQQRGWYNSGCTWYLIIDIDNKHTEFVHNNNIVYVSSQIYTVMHNFIGTAMNALCWYFSFICQPLQPLTVTTTMDKACRGLATI